MIQYTYDEYGNINSISGVLSSTLGIDNPFRYKGYYYDEETKLYYCKSRFYNPEWGRFLQVADISALNPSSINGLNLYAYASNNSVGIAYSSSGYVGSASDGMLSSSYSTLGNSTSVGSTTGRTNFSGVNGGINWSKTNFLSMKHYTVSLTNNPIIDISYTKTVQLNSVETFYSFSNIGNDGYSTGVGMNLGNWYGTSVYVTSDIGFGSRWQLTPWITGSSEWSLEDGISISGGIIVGDTTLEISVSVRNEPLLAYAACTVLAATPLPGARAVAATAACIIFIVDSFN